MERSAERQKGETSALMGYPDGEAALAMSHITIYLDLNRPRPMPQKHPSPFKPDYSVFSRQLLSNCVEHGDVAISSPYGFLV